MPAAETDYCEPFPPERFAPTQDAVMSDHAAPVPVTPATPVPPVRKKRWGRRLGIFALVVLVLLAVAVWAAPGVIARSGYKNTLVAQATADVHGKVEVGAVSLSWLHPIELYDVTVTDPEGRKVLAAGKVSTSKTLLELALDRSNLGTITVEKPRVEVTVEKGGTNVERVFAEYLKDDGKPKTSERTPIRVVVADGTVVLTDAERNETRQLDGVTATVGIPKLRTDPITLEAAAKSAASGTLTASGEIGVGGKLKLVADKFDTATLAPLVRRFEPTSVVGGVLTTDLTAEWKDDGFAADGKLNVTDLVFGGPWLGSDILRLKAVDLPAKLSFANGRLIVEYAKLSCDAGTIGFQGTIDTAALDKTFDQTGLKFDADCDVAKVATLLPGLLRVKPGTELSGGRVIAKLESAAGPVGTVWTGSVNTTKLEGRRDGKPLTWDQPLVVTFAGRVRADGLPVFDKLVVQSDFIGAQARGEPEQFTAVANIELQPLSAHLNDFLDLDGLQLNGSVRNLLVQTKPKAGGGYTLTVNGGVTNLAVLDKTGKGLREPSLKLTVLADGEVWKEREWSGARINSGTMTVTAGSEVLDVKLLDPISDVGVLASGRAKVDLTGDVGRWRSRLAPFIPIPKEWELGGTARQATAVVTFGEVITARNVKVAIANAVFRGAGLDIGEPDLRVETSDPDDGRITFDRKSGAVAFHFTQLVSETASGSTKRFEIKPDATGEYGASGLWNVVARVDRVQRMLKMQSDPTLSDQLRGTATGAVSLNATTFSRVRFTTDLTVKDFALGSAQNPSWTESQVTVKADGDYDLTADVLTLRSGTLGRDGMTATGKGRIGKLSTDVDLDVSGDLSYDLARLEPQLKKYLGKSAAATGQDTKPFRLAGNLLDGGKNLAVMVGSQPGSKPNSRTDLTHLNGNAAVGWKTLRAYGFDVGQAEVKATVDKGTVAMTPVEATFGGGKVRLEPALRLNPGAYDLTFKQGKIIDAAKLTPAACAEAIGYALPAIANVAQADGTISFDLGEHTIPLADPSRGVVKGNLTIHDATVSPGPIVSQLIEVIGLDKPKLQLSKGNVVPVRMENGRVHHSNFIINVGGTPVTTAGSVGVDGTLDLTVTVNVGGALAEKLLPNQPILQKALAKQTVSVTVGGTLTKPTLNRDAMKGQLAKVAQNAVTDAAKDAVKDAGKGAVDDLIKKGLDGLFKKK